MSSQNYTALAQNDEKIREATAKNEAPDSSCGVFSLRPRILQPCANIMSYTLFYSMAGLFSSTLSSYVNSQVTTLERQFGFSSKQTGLILAANDIGYLVSVLFISFSAARIHIPRALGVATVIFGLSGIVCSLPHFIFGAQTSLDLGQVNGTVSRSSFYGDLCVEMNETSTRCAAKPANDTWKVYLPGQVAAVSLGLIVLGMMLQGFGKAPRSSLTTTYVDDNTVKSSTGFYMGIIIACSMFGPVIAYVMGGVFSRMYVTLGETTLTPKHPRWIGAWWLGYVVFGSLALAAALPLFCFPRRLPGQRGKGLNQQDKGQNQMGDNQIFKNQDKILVTEDKTFDREFGGKIDVRVIRKPLVKTLAFIKDFLSSILRLLINPVYMCLTISSILVIFSVSGTSAYTPKYLESMFNLPAYKANYILAGEVLCSSCVGSFVGGFLTRRFKMSPMVALKFAILVICISMMATVTGFFFQCEQPKVHNWPGENSTCSSGCNCEDNSYFPICGSDGRTYYSPCTAGCVEREKGVYQNCTCISGGTASSGTCDYSCAHLYPYAVFFGIRLLFGTLSIIPKLILLLRCVNNKDKSLAIGFESFLVSLLGWLLGPLVFGYVIDGICVQWDVSCGVRGRCLLYDHRLFQLKLHGYIVVPGAGCLLFMFIAFFYARATGCLEGEATPVPRDVTEMTLVIDAVKHPPDEENHISRDVNDTDDVNHTSDDVNHTSDDVNITLDDANQRTDNEDKEKKYFEVARP